MQYKKSLPVFKGLFFFGICPPNFYYVQTKKEENGAQNTATRELLLDVSGTQPPSERMLDIESTEKDEPSEKSQSTYE